ncbi:hypothetical protein AFE_1660 [Acidithiobacillus ferrooxidans ATCC 23270]|uniref:Uncharacterized protein n=1 Tax=Acidithiobacillus ferrooxidans (strain ATCC 23270 / DSM 14882 / CIP 104768 / NCIMB 8455) TaxID=243159 RepID=B7JAZ8_ACIF2|nr:hypothetical protein AFE_1660 [Acidithiobacillus ferrooxidans ATCC 23270]
MAWQYQAISGDPAALRSLHGAQRRRFGDFDLFRSQAGLLGQHLQESSIQQRWGKAPGFAGRYLPIYAVLLLGDRLLAINHYSITYDLF